MKNSVHKQNFTDPGTGLTNSTTINSNVSVLMTPTSAIMDHDVKARHPEGDSMTMAKELLEYPQIQPGMMQSMLSTVTSLFTPSKIPPTGDNTSVANKDIQTCLTTSIVTRDVNRELNEYKDRMIWELSNFKKQLDMQSCTEVECTKQSLNSEFDHQLRNQTLTQMETINMLQHQINHLGVQLQQQQAAGCPLLPQAPLLPEVTVPPQPPPHYYNWLVPQPNDSLVEVMDILNRSVTNQYAILQETLRQ